MRPEPLYLFKSARRPLYRQQNLHVLGAERGSVVELAWNRSWVAAECYDVDSILPGTPVVFVFTDRPYTRFVPVRSGEVVEAQWEELSLRLWVSLGTWVGPPDGDVDAFTRALRSAHGEALPGEKFVARRRDSIRLVSFYDDREAEGWHRAVDAVLAMSIDSEENAYGGRVFFRIAGLRIDGEVLRARHEALMRNETAELLVEFHNPHLTEEERSGLALRTVASKDALAVRGPREIAESGVVVLALKSFSDAPELTLQVEPHPAEHTSLTVRFPRARLETRAGAAPPVQHGALLHLSDVVRRNVRGDAAAELAVLDALVPLLPDDQRLNERRAVLLLHSGDEGTAYAVLRGLDADRLDDDARFAYMRVLLRRGAVAPAVGLLDGVDLGEADRLNRLLAELAATEPPLLDRTVRELVTRLPEETDVRAVLEHTARRLTSPELIAEVASMLYYATGDAHGAAEFVSERRHTLRLAHPKIADVLIELAEAGAGAEDLDDVVSHRIANLIARGDVDAALHRLRRSTKALPRGERDRLYHRTADRLHDAGRMAEAVSVLVELTHAALATGDLETATEAVERATGLSELTGTAAPELLLDAIAYVKRAWSQLGELVEWRTAERERRAARIRETLLNRTILIVGGLRRDGQDERLRDLTGAEIETAEHFRGAGDPLEAVAQRIRAGRYALVVFRWQFSGHEVSDRIGAACAAADVPLRHATSGGVRGLEEAVWKFVSG
jgi:hypothetical protein